MITLDPILATAQDSDSRQPIVNINSTSFTESIPFEGNAFNPGTLDEKNPEIVEMSSGRLAVIIERNYDLYLLITDEDKIEWSEYNVYNPGSVTVLLASIAELSNGNLGIILVDKPANYRLRYLIVTTSGAIITSATILETTYWMDSPSIELLANDSYVLIHTYRNSSNQYSIQKRISSDFTTWGSSSTIAPVGLDNLKPIRNSMIKQIATGEVHILFDYQNDIQGIQEIVNVYSILSLDDTVTWSDPTKLTNYTIYGTIGKYPAIAERTNGDIEIAFQEEKNILQMDSSTPGWDAILNTTPDMYYNPTTNKIYAKQIYVSAGIKYLEAIIIIDVATWTIDKSYTQTSTPAINPYYRNVDIWYFRSKDDGKYSVCGGNSSIMVINVETDEITYYNLTNIAEYSLEQNISIDTYRVSIRRYYVDEASDRLYVFYSDLRITTVSFYWGYIDLTEQPDIITGRYTWTNLSGGRIWYDLGSFLLKWNDPPGVDIDNNLVMYSTTRALFVFELDSGALLHQIGFPGYNSESGVTWPIYHNGHIYGNNVYESGYGFGNYYGLVDINLSTEEIRYHRPSYATVDNYGLDNKRIIDGNRILIDGTHGVVIFDIATESWVLYNSTSLPGFPGGGYTVDYDPEEEMIFMGGSAGVTAFQEVGNFQQLQYMTGTYTTDWEYSEASILAEGYVNSQASLVIDVNTNILWAVWTHRDIAEYSTYWDSEIAEKNLTEYLTDSDIIINWDIDSPYTLNFTLSHGYLFDPSNSMSTLFPFVKKGRRIELQLGETIEGTDYLQDQGHFIVKDTSLSYSRGNYPSIQVSCEDLRSVWKEAKITASDYFSNENPTTIIETILQDYAGVDSGDMNIPTFVNTHNLYHQFIDQYLLEMINSILEHFNYFLHINVNGVVTARRIALNGSVDHVYTGEELVSYTPDDSFSSYLNRIIAKGEGLYELEVIYSTEIIQTLSGTVGWWGGTEVKRIYYSDDREKQCRNPNLVVNTSIKEFEIFLIKGGGKEYLSGIDPEEYWVEITIESPNLVAIFIATAAAILSVGYAALGCGAWFGYPPCGPYIFALTILTQIMGYLLGCIAQYDYEIWASPLGITKQTFQAQADDLVFQRQLNGMVVSEDMDDPFCYTIGQCQTVANNELAVVKAQRNRTSSSKIAHLQDEIGDIIQIQHPYTNLDLKIFLVGLTRTYTKGKSITDKIEGWLL